MKKISLTIVVIAIKVFAQHMSYSLDELYTNPENYLSQINEIKIDNNKLMFVGEKGKEKNITGPLISEIIKYSKMNDIFPQCIIDHTPEEKESYFTFHADFVTRPKGSDGSKAATYWTGKKIFQNVNLNIDRNTAFANYLYDADLKLKKLIMGHDLMRVRKLRSFAGFAEFKISDKVEEKSGYIQNNYETIFYLVPDSIIIRKSANNIKIDETKFKLFALNTFENIDSKQVLEEKWVDDFNNKIDLVFSKHKELSRIQEIFNLYFLLKNYPNIDNPSIAIKNDKDYKIPDRIKALKVCKQIAFLDPLINQPSRYRFFWLLISGAITFNYQNTVIIQQ